MRNWKSWKTWAHIAEIRFPATYSDAREFAQNVSSRGDNQTWLKKKPSSAGGLGIRVYDPLNDPSVDQGTFLQERIEGTSIGVTFLTSAFGTIELGMTESLPLEPHPWSDFIYRGSTGPFVLDGFCREKIVRFGNAVGSSTGWRGLWQADFVRTRDSLYLLEINPRWTAGMELLEYGWNLPLVTWHCRADQVTEIDWQQWAQHLENNRSNSVDIWEKLVLYAPCDFRPDQNLLDEWWKARWIEPAGRLGLWVADIPATLDFLPAGAPVCSLIGCHSDRETLHQEIQNDRRSFEMKAFFHRTDSRAGQVPMMEHRITKRNRVVSRGCLTILIATLAFVVLLVIGVPFLRERQRLYFEQQKADWRQREFDRVKNGDDHASIMDSKILPMLASDAECITNLRELDFSMAEITADDAQHVSKLAKVESLFFYDTRGADFVLENARDLPIKRMGFDMARLSPDSLRALSGFPDLTDVHFEHVMFPNEIAILKELPSRIKVSIPHPAENEPGFKERGEPSNAPQSR
jgi:predicted ATP-grasp superfamily ATP-dependent carboligase